MPATRSKRLIKEMGIEKLLGSILENKKLNDLIITIKKSLEQKQLNDSVLADLCHLAILCYQNFSTKTSKNNNENKNNGNNNDDELIDSLSQLMLTLPSELALNCISMDFKEPNERNIERSIRVSCSIVSKTNYSHRNENENSTTKVYSKLLSNIRTMLVSLIDSNLVRIGTNCISYLVESLITIPDETQRIQFLSDCLDTLSICVNPHFGLYIFERCAIRLGRAVLFDFQIASDFLFHSKQQLEQDELWKTEEKTGGENNNETNIEKYAQFVSCILPRLFVIPSFQPVCENFLNRIPNLIDLSFSKAMIEMKIENNNTFANNEIFKSHLMILLIGFRNTQKWNGNSIWKEMYSLIKTKFQ